jgi:Cd2+/Zn2+-exporting ATPase
MERIFSVKGLDCPHCSAEIETEASKLNGVNSAAVNLINQTLTIETDDVYEGDMLADITKIVHKHEPDVEVSEGKESSSSHDDEDEHGGKGEIIKLSVGAVVYVAGLVLTYIDGVNKYISIAVLLAAYLILGGGVLLRAGKNILKGRVFDENFLMTVSTVGALAIGEYPEAVAVMLFYQIGEFFEDIAVNRSRKSISSLMDIRPDSANVLRDGKITTIAPENVKKGEVIVVRPGEKVPLDGIITDGESMIDTSALTGESLPREVGRGEAVLSGCINQSGVLTVEVTKEFGESTVSRIIELVENAASRKAPAENFITKFSRYYTPFVCALAVLLTLIPPLFFGGAWVEWIKRSLVFLVISCPCALVISIPLTFFGGIGRASRSGVLVKGSNYLEALEKLDTVVFDKTGTLTKGVFKVSEIIGAEGFSDEQILDYAAKAESFSNHPIARSIEEAYKGDIDTSELSEYTEISGHGISVKSVSDGGKTILAGNEKLMRANNIEFEPCKKIGTKVYVAFDGQYVGCIIIADEIKADSRDAIAALKKMGVRKTVMLTGDEEKIAAEVSKKMGIDEYFAELLPQQKVEKLEDAAKGASGKIAFVGDGINDAPSLARADVGIAMGGLGSDAAIEAADVVLMTDEVSKLADAVRIAKATKRIVMQNIIFALGVKAAFLILGALGIAGMWIAVFGDVGVMVIAVLNAMRILKK